MPLINNDLINENNPDRNLPGSKSGNNRFQNYAVIYFTLSALMINIQKFKPEQIYEFFRLYLTSGAILKEFYRNDQSGN